MPAIIEDGQFDDAPENGDPRAGHSYIDASEPEGSESDWSDHSDDDEDEIDEAYDDTRVEDEDWEIAERDFTKQYNRLRQHVAVRTGNAQGTQSSINSSTTVAALPAVNHPKSATKSSTLASGPQAKDKTADQLAALAKYSSRLAKIDVPYTMGVGINRKGPSSYANMKDKSDRATNEQVLDPRTRLILFKMIGRGVIHDVNGCANVYHARTPDMRHLAIKIYKTSILVFKDRDKYMTGEYRFRKGYSRKNPRKMVRLWAEKEMRNLKRLLSAGIRCPEPLEVRENVLVMGFLGDKEGWASPRLKDAELATAQAKELYIELLAAVRVMFHQCKLVHADLSEYNILFHEAHLWIIDVSQSVEHDHPSAFDFLRNDLKNVEDFFGKLGVPCLGLRKTFEFVTTENLEKMSENEDDEVVLERWMEERETVGESTHEDKESAASNGHQSAQNAHEDAVFLQSYIPRTLNEVYDPERDVALLKRGDGDRLIYADTIGLIEPSSAKKGTVRFEDTEGVDRDATQLRQGDNRPEEDEEKEGEEGTSSENDAEYEDGNQCSNNENLEFQIRKPRGHRHEDREAKKERKRAVKAEAKEKRKNKMPKAEKKKLMKKSRGG
ncbi:atypical rio rio1 protein kinase [Moniliophthora roreri]|uniref:Serine/threonine-protein kinase RIO1 n=1 Tax=Moniliophthora roreri TaxID=221103 RepID=A0A0W0FBU7_MONRR|nr:atypical rio rio1 protein kinase [Moniliophthora roreri]